MDDSTKNRFRTLFELRKAHSTLTEEIKKQRSLLDEALKTYESNPNFQLAHSPEAGRINALRGQLHLSTRDLAVIERRLVPNEAAYDRFLYRELARLRASPSLNGNQIAALQFLRRVKIVNNFLFGTSLYLTLDGMARISAGFNGRNPGFIPAIDLGSTLAKRAFQSSSNPSAASNGQQAPSVLIESAR